MLLYIIFAVLKMKQIGIDFVMLNLI